MDLLPALLLPDALTMIQHYMLPIVKIGMSFITKGLACFAKVLVEQKRGLEDILVP